MPSPKPPRISAADAGSPSSSTSAIRIAVAASASARNSQSARSPAPTLGAVIAAVDMESFYSTVYEPSPSAFFRSSHLVRADATGRFGSAVHSTIEPS